MSKPWMTTRGGRSLLAWLLGLSVGFGGIGGLAPARVFAQPEEPAPASQQDSQKVIDEAVARGLFERGKALYEQGAYADAKILLGEALERDPVGPVAQEAQALLKLCDEKLGTAPATSTEAPLDPYGSVRDETLDPYGGVAEAAPADPEKQDSAEDPGVTREADLRQGRRTLLTYGTAYGFVAGAALSGADDSAAFWTGGLLGAGAGLAGTYLLTRNREITAGQAATVSWTGVWTGTVFGFMTDLATGIDATTTGEYLAGVSLGGLLGSGAGWLIAKRLDPSADDVALVSSLGLYGTAAGLLVGVGLDPAESEAYSVNALVGAAVGLGAGLYAAQRVDVSRRRMLWVDLGAALGATAPWLLLAPALGSDEPGESGNDGLQAAGWLSTLGLFGGAYLAWRWTAKMDKPERIGKLQIATVPGLIQRAPDGQWALGAPGLRPAGNPALAPAAGTRGWVIDLLGGNF